MAETPTRIATVSAAASGASKAQGAAHALPFGKNQLGIGALISALLALVNSQAALVTPPWILWAVAGLLVVGWIVHVIVVDHASIAGSMEVHARAADPAGRIFSDLAAVIPEVVAFLDKMGHMAGGNISHAGSTATAADASPAAATAPSTGAP